MVEFGSVFEVGSSSEHDSFNEGYSSTDPIGCLVKLMKLAIPYNVHTHGWVVYTSKYMCIHDSGMQCPCQEVVATACICGWWMGGA